MSFLSITQFDSFLVVEWVLLLFSIGAMGGFLSGLLGVGGGILFVPALFFTLTSLGQGEAHTMHIAVGTSLAIVLATGSTSALAHYRRGAVDMSRVRLWGVYIVGGVLAGSLFASVVNGKILGGIFASITLLISVYMAFGRETPPGEAGRHVPVVVQRGICMGIGVLSSMIGVGGAIMTIPLMSYTGMQIQRAIGTGAALGILISLPGALGYAITGLPHLDELPPWSLGYISLPAVLLIIPASMLAAPVGVKASHALPKRVLRRVFAVVLVIVSVRMFMSL